MLHAAGLIARKGIQRNGVDAAEDAFFNVWAGLPKLLQQQLDLLPLGGAAIVGALGFLGKAAGALEKFQPVVALPGQNVLLMDAIKRPDQRHAGEIFAVELGRHGLQLRPVKHAQHRGLHHIVEMVPQSDLIAAQRPGLTVEMAPAHPGAEIAGVLFRAVGHAKHIALKNGDGDAQQLGIVQELLPVFGVIARIHHQKAQLEGDLAVGPQLLHELGQQHGILSAGDADGDPVAGLDQPILLDSENEGVPELLPVFFDDAALDALTGVQFPFHSVAPCHACAVQACFCCFSQIFITSRWGSSLVSRTWSLIRKPGTHTSLPRAESRRAQATTSRAVNS